MAAILISSDVFPLCFGLCDWVGAGYACESGPKRV